MHTSPRREALQLTLQEMLLVQRLKHQLSALKEGTPVLALPRVRLVLRDTMRQT